MVSKFGAKIKIESLNANQPVKYRDGFPVLMLPDSG
jgi:hypothetical protein